MYFVPLTNNLKIYVKVDVCILLNSVQQDGFKQNLKATLCHL